MGTIVSDECVVSTGAVVETAHSPKTLIVVCQATVHHVQEDGLQSVCMPTKALQYIPGFLISDTPLEQM